MDVVLLCIELQLEGLDLAGDLNLVDFGAGVVQPPSQWCLDSGRVDFCLFLKEYVGFARQRLSMRGNLFLPCFRWRNWRGLFAACHFFVSLIYILDIVAKLRFLGWKFWKLIGSALAPSTAG